MKHNAKTIFARVVIFLFIAIIISYGFYQARGIIAGPYIYIESPTNGVTSTSSLLTISGKVTRVKEVYLDDRPIFVDLEGRFYERLLLNSGYNIMEIKAKDAQGRETIRTIEVVYRPTS